MLGCGFSSIILAPLGGSMVIFMPFCRTEMGKSGEGIAVLKHDFPESGHMGELTENYLIGFLLQTEKPARVSRSFMS